MLPHSVFGIDRSKSHGLAAYCPKCMNMRQAAWINAQPGLDQYRQAKSRAKKKGLEFSITFEEMLSKDTDTCPYLGIPIFWHLCTPNVGRSFTGAWNSKSIDRVDSTKGYTIDNIIIVSWRANRLKGDATSEELCTLAASLKTILTEHEATN